MNWISHLELSKLIEDAYEGIKKGDQRKVILANIYKDKYIKIAKEFNISEAEIINLFATLNKSLTLVEQEFEIVESCLFELKQTLERFGKCQCCGSRISSRCDLVQLGKDHLCLDCAEWGLSFSKV